MSHLCKIMCFFRFVPFSPFRPWDAPLQNGTDFSTPAKTQDVSLLRDSVDVTFKRYSWKSDVNIPWDCCFLADAESWFLCFPHESPFLRRHSWAFLVARQSHCHMTVRLRHQSIAENGWLLCESFDIAPPSVAVEAEISADRAGRKIRNFCARTSCVPDRIFMQGLRRIHSPWHEGWIHATKIIWHPVWSCVSSAQRERYRTLKLHAKTPRCQAFYLTSATKSLILSVSHWWAIHLKLWCVPAPKWAGFGPSWRGRFFTVSQRYGQVFKK